MELLMNYFKSFKKTAQRIEALPEYNASESNKSFFYYNNGNITEDYSDAGWCKNIKEWVNEGKSIERIRVIPKKFNPYLSFEFTCYEKNILSGEKFFAIYEKDYKKICEELEDVWIFDSKNFIKLNYDTDGKFINSELINNKDYNEIYRKLKENTFDIQEIFKIIRNQEFNLY